ncbi:MAG: FAD:protein FMN transferase [Bacteroidales bacterium]|nr:FAD:protein FMN transferase [Bacteroidales bacterium]
MNKKLSIWRILFLLFLIAGTIYIIRKSQTAALGEQGVAAESYTNIQGSIFGTTYSITYGAAEDLQEEITAELEKVDNSLSPFNKNSIITAINNNGSYTLDTMFTEVFTLACEISRNTEGAFDITVAPLVNAWGFGFKNAEKVDSATIDSLMQLIGYNTVTLAGGRIEKQNPGTMLDCSAIAKGYGCDVVARLLSSRGIENYMVEIGGEVVTKGVNPSGRIWSIGITKPTEQADEESGELFEIINISGKSLATSGNYRRYRIEGGKKYAHTIDPRTGYPVEHTLLSATVIADNCATADAYATAFMVVGIEKAMELCRSYNIDAYFIYQDDNGNMGTLITEGFKEYLAAEE